MEGGNKILIVDDNPTFCAQLKNILQGAYQPVVATSGREALEIMAGEDGVELILLDIIMPQMDGYEVCLKLKALEKTQDIPIIFLTSKDEAEDEAEGFGYGVVDYIIKPISPLRLLARIKTHLQVQHQKKLLMAKTRELQTVLDDLQTLRGIIPICASCKKIRDDTGYWNRLEEYLRAHSLVEFTHSICPDCARKLYPKFYPEEDNATD